MNDACVIAYLLRPELFTAEYRRVRIELNDEEQIGRTILDDRGTRIRVVTSIDVAGFFDLLFEFLSRPRRAER
jgi:purine nucleosidase